MCAGISDPDDPKFSCDCHLLAEWDAHDPGEPDLSGPTRRERDADEQQRHHEAGRIERAGWRKP